MEGNCKWRLIFFLLWVFFFSDSKVYLNVLVSKIVKPCLRPKVAASDWKSDIIHFTMELVRMRRSKTPHSWQFSSCSESDWQVCACSLHEDKINVYLPTGLASLSSLVQHRNDLTGHSFQKYIMLLSALFNTCIANCICLKEEPFYSVRVNL